jgi:hypothetical protein
MGLFEVCKHADHDARMLLTTSWKDHDGEVTQMWQCEECKAIKVTTTFGLIEDVTKMRPDQLPRTPFG